MHFPGQEPGQPKQAEGNPLSTFTYKTFSGREVSVQAHSVHFMPAHVAFFREVGNDMSTLVLAEANSNVQGLKEHYEAQ